MNSTFSSILQLIVRQLRRLPWLVKLLILAFIWWYIIISINIAILEQKIRSVQKCYTDKNLIDKSVRIEDLFDDLELSTRQPTPNKSIFFHVTSCSKSGFAELTLREICAIESAATAHPEYDVFVLFTSPVGFRFSKNDSLAVLQRHSNVHFRNVNLWNYARDTPLNELINDPFYASYVFASINLMNKLGDFLRFISLYKYGGICLDMDVIVRKSLESLGSDFIGLDSDNKASNHVMSFNQTGQGHDTLHTIILDISANFNNFIEPGKLNDILLRICGGSILSSDKFARVHCMGVALVSARAFYPIPNADWSLLFEPMQWEYVKEAISDAYMVHFWQNESSQRQIEYYRNSSNNTAALPGYLKLASDYCPDTFRTIESIF